MKIIITYASAGGGHRIAAEAIYDYFKKNYQNVDARIIDALDYANPVFSALYSKGYYYLASRLNFLWRIFFYGTAYTVIGKTFSRLCRLNCGKFIEYLIKEKPQVIVSTHFLPCEIISNLKLKKRLTAKLISVITDFGVHPLWVQSQTQGYVVSSEATRLELKKSGVLEDKIHELGIPLRSGFPLPKTAHKEFCALLIAGSFGFSSIEEIVRQLQSEVNLIVVCGNNKKLYRRLKRKGYAAEIFGFSEQIPQLMSRADLIITKPGGLSIVEALAMDLPLVFIKGIPGQEAENTRILLEYGCALCASHISEVKRIVRELKQNPEKIEALRCRIQKIKKPFATKEICSYVCASSAGPAC